MKLAQVVTLLTSVVEVSSSDIDYDIHSSPKGFFVGFLSSSRLMLLWTFGLDFENSFTYRAQVHGLWAW